MTIKELHKHLEALMAEDEYRADAQVTFGEAFDPVVGGTIAKNAKTGLAVLNLAPIALDKVGGF